MGHNPPSNHVSVFLKDMEVDVRIGIHPWEQKPQRLIVNIELYADPSYLLKVSEDTIIDYGRVYNAVMEWPSRPHVKLIETYARELLDLAFSFEQVQEAHISIAKADIFPSARGAGVNVYIDRKAYRRISFE